MNWAWQPLLPASAQIQAAGGNVTVALTGISSTGSAGSLVPSSAVPVTGIDSTGSAGSVTASQAITGISSSGSPGTVVPSITVALTGISSTGSAGSLVPSNVVPITGISSTGTPGTVTASIGGDVSVALTGISSTGSAGTLLPSSNITLTGAESASFAGTVSVQSVVVAIETPNTGGWESYLAHRKRQDQRVVEEEKLQEQIESQRLAVEDAQLRLELEQERKAEEEQRDNRRNRVISQIARGIKAQQLEIEQMMAHLEALMVLDALERDQELQALIQKRRNAAIVLLLYAA